jgi:hypothetical protein
MGFSLLPDPEKLRRFPVSSTALIAANLVPLAGAMFLGWSVFEIIFLFWLENVAVGLVNVLRMGAALILRRAWGMITMIPFFIVHYGIFTLVHGVFVLAFFGPETVQPAFAGGAIPDTPEEYVPLWVLIRENLWLVLGIAGLFGSHLFSFAVNFIARGEIYRVPPEHLMFQPYGRIVVLHVVVLLGGAAAQALGAPMPALILLVLLKTLLDLGAHLAERAKLASTS